MAAAHRMVGFPNPESLNTPKYLTAKDIATELQVSRSRAYDIIHECAHIRVGRALRVSRKAFETWKRVREEIPAAARRDRAAEEAYWLAHPSTRPIVPRTKPVASGTESSDPLDRPIVPRTGRLSKSGDVSSVGRFERPIVPRTSRKK